MKNAIARLSTAFVLAFSAATATAQLSEWTSLKASQDELAMTVYAKDTSASAVMLDDRGYAYVSDREGEDIVLERYLRIKILRKEGLDQADFSIDLRKYQEAIQSLISVDASTYNLEGGTVRKTPMTQKKAVYDEKVYEYLNRVKFALPDVKVGSVIEVRYRINTPFIWNFVPWRFQSTIPKVRSEYITMIPGHYMYNVTLRGYLKFTKEESDLVSNCFLGSECVRSRYIMENIPALAEEEFMTARSNFESALHYELSQITYTTGRVEKFTKEWKDVDSQLLLDKDFGDQIKKAKLLFADKIGAMTGTATDTLARAKAIFNFFASGYKWDEFYGWSTHVGVKKAFETRTGSVGDINLSLVGALQAAGMNAAPVMLATRDKGVPVMLHPVISDFNYVVAAVLIGGKWQMLDATEPYYPFGLLPRYCMNGKGRLMTKQSVWIDLKPSIRERSSYNLNVRLDSGKVMGTATTSHQGYAAVSQRSKIRKAESLAAFAAQIGKDWGGVTVKDYVVANKDSVDAPLKETMKVERELDEQGGRIYFSPFIGLEWEDNPFRADQRSFPVDFATAFDDQYTLVLTVPDGYEIDETPTPAGLNLPNGGGKLLFNVSELGNKVSVTFNLSINRSVFDPGEYTSLKEFFARVTQIRQSQIVLKKKT